MKRPNVEVRARKGYWAYTADDVAKSDGAAQARPAPPVTSGARRHRRAASRPPGALLDRDAKGPTAGQSRVTFAWEPMPPVARAPRGADSGVDACMLTATGADGRPVFRGRVPERRAGTSAAAAAAANGSPPPSPPARAPRSMRRRVSCSCG